MWGVIKFPTLQSELVTPWRRTHRESISPPPPGCEDYLTNLICPSQWVALRFGSFLWMLYPYTIQFGHVFGCSPPWERNVALCPSYMGRPTLSSHTRALGYHPGFYYGVSSYDFFIILANGFGNTEIVRTRGAQRSHCIHLEMCSIPPLPKLGEDSIF